jgi:hypothetical protein
MHPAALTLINFTSHLNFKEISCFSQLKLKYSVFVWIVNTAMGTKGKGLSCTRGKKYGVFLQKRKDRRGS